MTKIGIIVGSTRPGRLGPQVARWVEKAAGERDDAEFDLVDVADYNLPLFDEPRSPLLRDYQHAHTRAWSAKVAELDGYVFVTPEYNRSIPGALKNAIDVVYHEWNHKAAGLVGYGSTAGGARALEHLRGIAGAVMLAPVHTEVTLSMHNDFENYAVFNPDPRHEGALRQMLGEVIALADALAPLRGT
ncbi:NADPH-dependent FMN reductase [Actinacidiphila oryziradicis]|uniref:NAD(P)H-dependent oxidoreductase n=1 Tax=Actinacidiphila oryziradicis TaxID=2571141 RepID=A0A4U0SRB7_9ACTN|nr:NAD(P)H-dependent oxidoreductase [Actinacidiphila oryziradicis]TKA02925.1 NAD(P)H-dependent oxidoreductase [Actinacidiphila oryziradicis]